MLWQQFNLIQDSYTVILTLEAHDQPASPCDPESIQKKRIGSASERFFTEPPETQ